MKLKLSNNHANNTIGAGNKNIRRFFKQNFHALYHKNFRYYWFGQCISLIGTWMQSMGQSWLVYTLTKSALLLSLVSTIQFLPVMLFSLFAGVMIDRFPKKKVLIATQTVSMVLAFMLSILVFTHTVQYWHILILALILGVTNTLDMPTRQSFMIEIAGKEDLMNAISLNSAVFNLARIIGPAIGGIMLASFGAGWCFFINGISFLAVIYGLLRIDAESYVRDKKENSNIIHEIHDGIKYIVEKPLLMETLILVTIVGIFVFNYNVFLPIFTKSILHKGSGAYGTLMAVLGVGSLFGALATSIKSKTGPKSLQMIFSTIAISVIFIILGFCTNYFLTIVLLIINGFFNIIFSTTANSTLQINSSNEYRARVMSVYTLLFAGITPFGSLTSGVSIEYFGAGKAYMLFGIIMIILTGGLIIVFKGRNMISNSVKEGK